MTGRLIAVVGPSGVGKDTVMTMMAENAPSLGVVRRVITRPADAGGEDFDSVDVEAFKHMQSRGDFALSWMAHGLHYGIPGAIRSSLTGGTDLLVNLSRGVLEEACQKFPGLITILLTARPEVLAARLAERGREDKADIARRLGRANFALPESVTATEIDNSGALDATVDRTLAVLYPVSA
ncbi:MAG: phosphonate metabolism protein/1,5-bisphosphokinase (PRPP-forming) PhnN [Pseudomonadota bacterium]